MADEELVQLERAWRADPQDRVTLQRLIAARRRVGQPVPRSELDAQREPARVFRSPRRSHVYAEEAQGNVSRIGQTPGPVHVPVCRTWWVEPEDELTPELVSELEEQGVTGLRLSRWRLTPERVELLLGVQGLRTLSLHHCEGVDTPFLERLEALERLESLDLSESTGWKRHAECFGYPIEEDGLAALARLPGLMHLNLYKTNVDVSGLGSLGEISGLRTLCLDRLQFDGDLLAALAPLQELRFLSMNRCGKLSSKGLGHLPPLPALRRLDLVDCFKLTNPCLAHLSRLPGLEELRFLPKSPTNAKGVAHLAGLGLRKLTLKVKDAAAGEQVAALENLVSLDLSGDVDSAWASLTQNLQQLRELKAPFFSGEELAELTRLSALEVLEVNDFPEQDHLEPEELAAVATIPTLRDLRLRVWGADGTTLEALAKLDRLERLSVFPHRLGDPTVREWELVARLPHLRALTSDCTPEALRALRGSDLTELALAEFGAAHVAELTHWPALATLRVPDADVNDLEALRGLPGLERLGVSSVSDEEFDRLRAALPECTLELREAWASID